MAPVQEAERLELAYQGQITASAQESSHQPHLRLLQDDQGQESNGFRSPRPAPPALSSSVGL